MAAAPDIQLTFVKQALDEYNKRVVAEMTNAMQKLAINILRSCLNYQSAFYGWCKSQLNNQSATKCRN